MRTIPTLALGLTFLLLLAACVPFQSSDEERVLTILYWQAPTLPGPYLAAGYKDRDAGAITLEPLASYNPNGDLVPRLAEDIPTLANGGLPSDLMSITWRLREGLKWSDGSDVTADDVVFTWRYCVDEATGCTAHSAFSGIASVEAVDELTVRINFEAPTPYPYSAFVSAGSPILSREQFAGCVGAAATTCEEQNTAPLGTGPYRITGFTPNESAEYERNPHYRGEEPYFDRVLLKGGGDAISAARAVMEAGEADYAWNLQVAPEVLTGMQAAGHGAVVAAFASDVERIVVNQTNADPALGDDRSEYLEGRNPHPFLTFTPIPRAMSMAIDRKLIAERLYGFAAEPTCNLITGPPNYVSSANDGCLTQDIEGANRLLDESGVLDTDGDGIREHEGVPLRIVYQTSTNDIRQATQELVRDWWRQIGHRDGAGAARRQPLLRRRSRDEPERIVSQVLRGRADVHDRTRYRSSAAPVRPPVRPHPDAGQRLGRRQRRPRLQRRVRRALHHAVADHARAGARGAGQAAERHSRAELLPDSARESRLRVRAREQPEGRAHERLGQRALEHRGVAPLGGAEPRGAG